MSILDGEGSRSGGPTRSRPHGNLRALRILVLLLFGLLAARLADMQLVNGEEYARRSKENHLRATNLVSPRGLIVDRNGNALVENVPVYRAVVIPEFLPASADDRRTLYLWIENSLAVPALQVANLVEDAEQSGNRGQSVVVKDGLDEREAMQVEEAAARFEGLSLSVSAGRSYVAGDIFSHILGYVGAQTAEEYLQYRKQGYQLSETVGKAGLESRYETQLRGKTGVSATEVDAAGHVLQVLDTVEPVPGNTLRLSIDSDLQSYVAEVLEAARDESPVAAAVVMDANTGAVLAMVSLPTYDNNLFGAPDRLGEYDTLLRDPRRPLINHVLTPSAPGSTFKLVTAAAALQYGNITPQTGRNVASAVLEVKGENGIIYPMRDWRAHGYVDLRGAIAWSSNIYFFMASCGIPDEAIKGLGRDVEEAAVRLGYYARSFGFGEATGIDLDAAEEDGVIPSPDWKRRAHSGPGFNRGDREWYYADTCYMGIGQGDVLATPMQIAVMTAAIANGGYVLTPHVVDQVLNPDGSVAEAIPVQRKKVPVDPENLQVIREGMRQSVAVGAGSLAAIDSVVVAGKTGTAEFGQVLPNGHYLEHGWFTGFAPFDNPEVVVTVYFDLGVGGVKAAPVAGKILDYYWRTVRP